MLLFGERSTPDSLRVRTMKNYVQLKFITIYGAPIFLHWSVLCVAGGVLALSIKSPILAAIAICSYFGVILLHEFGHAFFAHRYECRINAIRLSVFHGSCEYDGTYLYSEKEEVIISWGGVLAQFVVAIPLIVLSKIPVLGEVDAFGPIVAFGGYISLLVAVVNLAPSPFLDGGKAWKIVPIFLSEVKTREKKKRS